MQPLCHFSVHIYDEIVFRFVVFKLFFTSGMNVVERDFAVVWHDDVEDEIDVRVAVDHPEVVNTKFRVKSINGHTYALFKVCELLVFGVYGVHVDVEPDVHLVPHIVFDVVDDIVAFDDVNVCRHFHVRHHKTMACAVTVHDKVVNADHAVIGENLCRDFVHEFLGRFFAEQWRYRVFEKQYA